MEQVEYTTGLGTPEDRLQIRVPGTRQISASCCPEITVQVASSSGEVHCSCLSQAKSTPRVTEDMGERDRVSAGVFRDMER